MRSVSTSERLKVSEPPYAAYPPGVFALCPEGPTLPQTNLDDLVTLKNGDIDGLSAIVLAGPPDSANGYTQTDLFGAPGACNCKLDCQAYDALKMWDFIDLLNTTSPGADDRGFTADICGDASGLPDKVNQLLTGAGLGGYCISFGD